MRVLIGALAVVLLAGCAKSLVESRADGPQATFYSGKSVDSVSKCILFSWQEFSWYGQHFGVFIQPTASGGNTVYVNQRGRFVDVEANEGKTRVRYYQNDLYGSMEKDFSSRTQKCL